MGVFDADGYALGFEERHRGDEVGFVAGFEVELEELLLTERFAHGFNSGVRCRERLMITLYASWHDDSKAHQCLSRMFSQQLLLHSMA